MQSEMRLHKANVTIFSMPFFDSLGNNFSKRPNGFKKVKQSSVGAGGERLPNSLGIVPTRLFRPASMATTKRTDHLGCEKRNHKENLHPYKNFAKLTKIHKA